MKLSKNNILLIFLLFIPVSTMFCQLNNTQNNRILTAEEREVEEEIQSGNTETLNNYISSVLEMPIPESYILESSYYNYKDYSSASDALGKNKYPDFYGKHGEELKKQIKSNPIDFKYMIFDYKLLREGYEEPN